MKKEDNDKWENTFCPVEYLPLIIPLWKKYKLRFYDLNLFVDDAKTHLLYFSLEGSEKNLRAYTNEFHGNREYYGKEIKKLFNSSPPVEDTVGELEKAEAEFAFYNNPPERMQYDTKIHKFIKNEKDKGGRDKK
jgi:hypothetical protein